LTQLEESLLKLESKWQQRNGPVVDEPVSILKHLQLPWYSKPQNAAETNIFFGEKLV
jgi:hypothetical protein